VNVVVIGRSRMARAFERVLTPRGDSVQVIGSSQLIGSTIRSPDLIVNTSAFTDVDSCEKKVDRALAKNAKFAGIAALWASGYDCPFVHVSTDYVFGGFKTGPYAVMDRPFPLNRYGWTKLVGEHAVIDLHPNPFIVRMGWLWGFEYGNAVPARIMFDDSIGRQLLVHPQLGKPTLIDCVVLSIADLALGRISTGIHHIAPVDDVLTWAGFMSLFSLDVKETVTNPRGAKRPKVSGLVPTIATCSYEQQVSLVDVDDFQPVYSDHGIRCKFD